MAKVRSKDMIRLSTGERISLGDAIDQKKVYLKELPPTPGSKNPRHFALEYPNGDMRWSISEMLFDSRSGSGAFRPAAAEEIRDRCGRAYVWVVENSASGSVGTDFWSDQDNVYLDEDAPAGGNNLERASEYAQHAAISGDHDRVVSCGSEPLSSEFRILRHYKAGTGRRVI